MFCNLWFSHDCPFLPSSSVQSFSLDELSAIYPLVKLRPVWCQLLPANPDYQLGLPTIYVPGWRSEGGCTSFACHFSPFDFLKAGFHQIDWLVKSKKIRSQGVLNIEILHIKCQINCKQIFSSKQTTMLGCYKSSKYYIKVAL